MVVVEASQAFLCHLEQMLYFCSALAVEVQVSYYVARPAAVAQSVSVFPWPRDDPVFATACSYRLSFHRC